ncbi:MAG: DinB family protein [Candidatus Limnocylindrales bacterium]
MSYDERTDLLIAYRVAPAAVRALVQAGAPAAIERMPDDGGWSARRILGHLATAAEGTAARLVRIVNEDRPALQPFDDAGEDAMPVDEAVERFATARASEMAVLDAADDAGWGRIGDHPAHGPISIRDIVRHMSSHDMEHVGEIGRLLG